MKKIYRFFLITAFCTASCDEKKTDTNTEENKNTISESTISKTTEENTILEEDLSNKAVLLWDASTFNTASGKDRKWVASYQFGNTFTLTGKSEVNPDDNRKYLEVIGPDGKSGWINDYIIVTNAKVAVAISEITLYKNPDVMSVTSDVINKASIIVVSAENKNGFRMVYGKEKTMKGYINNLTQISYEPIDLKLALFYHKAMAKKTNEERIKALKILTSDDTNANSKLFSMVSEKLDELITLSTQSINIDTINTLK